MLNKVYKYIYIYITIIYIYIHIYIYFLAFNSALMNITEI